MRKTILMLLIILPLQVLGQVPSFLGVPFGSTFQDVEATFDIRFNYANKYVPTDKSLIEYGNSYVSIGNIYKFPTLIIHFKPIIGKSIMYMAELGGKIEKQSTELISKRDQLKIYYSKKYPYTSYYLPKGGTIKFVKFGYDSDNIVGEIQVCKWTNEGKIEGYNLRIVYFPTIMELMDI